VPLIPTENLSRFACCCHNAGLTTLANPTEREWVKMTSRYQSQAGRVSSWRLPRPSCPSCSLVDFFCCWKEKKMAAVRRFLILILISIFYLQIKLLNRHKQAHLAIFVSFGLAYFFPCLFSCFVCAADRSFTEVLPLAAWSISLSTIKSTRWNTPTRKRQVLCTLPPICQSVPCEEN
jgi:hypothetical protein